MPAAPVMEVKGLAWRRGARIDLARAVPEETAVAITYDGATHAVMMATPADLEDFGRGFSLTEGIVDEIDEIEAIERIDTELGIEIRMRLRVDRGERLAARRRSLAGPVGCGLCGLEGLEAAMRPPRPVAARGPRIAAGDIVEAVEALAALQPMNLRTHAVHAAAFWRPGAAVGPVREDVGRHNALDKLAGALAMRGAAAAEGVLLITSRLSVEIVQKAAMIGAPLVAAVSAPTAEAIRIAEAAGITLLAVARADGFEVFGRADRIRFTPPASEAGDHVA